MFIIRYSSYDAHRKIFIIENSIIKMFVKNNVQQG